MAPLPEHSISSAITLFGRNKECVPQELTEAITFPDQSGLHEMRNYSSGAGKWTHAKSGEKKLPNSIINKFK